MEDISTEEDTSHFNNTKKVLQVVEFGSTSCWIRNFFLQIIGICEIGDSQIVKELAKFK